MQLQQSQPRQASAPKKQHFNATRSTLPNSFQLDDIAGGESDVGTGDDWAHGLHQTVAADEARAGVTASDWNVGGALDAEHQPELPPNHSSHVTYTHETVGLNDAVNTPEDKDASSDQLECGLWARLKRTEDNPFSRKNKSPRSEKKLVKTTTRDKSNDPEWQQVKSQEGSIEQPILSNQMIEDDIFLGKKPKVDDIIQGATNDCYFLAAITSIVNKDPVRLRQMMTWSGESLTVDFHRMDRSKAPGQQWVPAPVTVDATFLHRDFTGPTLVGANFRVGEDPKSAEWYAEVDNGVLSIHKEAAYEAALWMPLLEKAYAKFQDQWGAYGEGKGEHLDPGKRQTMLDKNHTEEDLDNGYKLLNYGANTKVYPMFFGEEVADQAFHDPQTGDADVDNATLIEFLLQHKGVGLEAGEEVYLEAMHNQHAYTVLSSDLRDHDGQPVELSLEEVRAGAASRVSTSLSTIVVRNPYGNGVRNMDSFGTREDDHNGESTVSLDEFRQEFYLYNHSRVG